ncbi:hypothetical protein G6O67_000568 [Ophiocordyceps sinensis]|uniref:Uncharacterized protein n=1 Tax=Ophiocordyceps sinensis TaxID=72228 RepID=A0A8H4PZI0_9HYPO|nr:hypothetical protein G6O67_000568 [Ophiocordyceps sinensis]
MVTDHMGLPPIPLMICTDSYSLYECLVKLGTNAKSSTMSSLKDYSFTKLKGSVNFSAWSLRMESVFIREKLSPAILDATHTKSQDCLALIRLMVDDGPLSQIKHHTSVKAAWDALKTLYNPVNQAIQSPLFSLIPPPISTLLATKEKRLMIDIMAPRQS